MQRINELLKRPGIRYILVGGSVYVLELALIVLFQHAGMAAVPAVGLAFLFGLTISFVLQKFVTFGDKRTQRKVVGLQLVAVIALVIFNLCFSMLMTQLLQHVMPAVAIRTIALGITTIWNFYLYKTTIFKGAEEPIA